MSFENIWNHSDEYTDKLLFINDCFLNVLLVPSEGPKSESLIRCEILPGNSTSILLLSNLFWLDGALIKRGNVREIVSQPQRGFEESV